MTAVIRTLPGMATRCRRLTENAKAEAEAEAIARAVKRAKAMITDPRGYTDAQLGTACAWFMRLSNAQRDDDGNVYYQRADQHIFAINKRQQIARNRAKCRAALEALDETPARIALRHGKQLGAVAVGYALAVAAGALLWWAGVVVV